MNSQREHDPLEGVSTHGMIVTGARRSRFSSAFMPVIADAVEHVSAMGGRHSLYVYGSVATGMAQAGESDVDLVTIGLDPAQAGQIGKELSAKYLNLCRGVEVGAAQLPDYEGDGDEAYGNRVFLRHYCVHLAGPDMGRSFPDFPADVSAARGFNGDIGLCLARWRIEVLREPYSALLARRVARKTLLAVAGLVSIHDSTWTTDRIGAARRWSLVRPQLAASLEKLVSWSAGENPEPSPSEVQVVLVGAVATVVDEFRERIGLWAP